jgi:hypothetical protein
MSSKALKLNVCPSSKQRYSLFGVPAEALGNSNELRKTRPVGIEFGRCFDKQTMHKSSFFIISRDTIIQRSEGHPS